MTDHTATLTSKGQVTLPAKLRKALGLRAGDQVTFVEGKKGEYRILPRLHRFEDLRGIVKGDKAIKASDVDRWIAEARAVRSETTRR
jgi:AbrB family looped-hinge helix DNA binding protein